MMLCPDLKGLRTNGNEQILALATVYSKGYDAENVRRAFKADTRRNLPKN